jgi:hypothetical protein
MIYRNRIWLTQFVCAPQFFKTPKGLCGHTVCLRVVRQEKAVVKLKIASKIWYILCTFSVYLVELHVVELVHMELTYSVYVGIVSAAYVGLFSTLLLLTITPPADM